MHYTQFLNAENKFTPEWKGLETGRKEDRNYELKKEASYNYLLLLGRSSRNPIAGRALLELCGSKEGVKPASGYAEIIRSYVRGGIHPSAIQQATAAAHKRSAATRAGLVYTRPRNLSYGIQTKYLHKSVCDSFKNRKRLIAFSGYLS